MVLPGIEELSPLGLPWGIDIHVHGRDEEQSYKTTIKEVLELARLMGIWIIFDMPNPERPVINRDRVWERLALVPLEERDRYRLYVGLTGDKDQIMEALWCYDNIPEVIGFKMFAGKSVGDLSVIEMSSQFMVYSTLAEMKYGGVVAVHCEKETLMDHNLWNPENPISHTWARPEACEIGSASDQIMFVRETGFMGWLHICHASSPITVYLKSEARKQGMRISCEIAPHYILWNSDRMQGPDGYKFKMNPALRGKDSVELLRDQFVNRQIDLIATDHATHTMAEKKPPLCMSGIQSMKLYGRFVTEFLPKGLGLAPDQIQALMRDNALRIFREKL